MTNSSNKRKGSSLNSKPKRQKVNKTHSFRITEQMMDIAGLSGSGPLTFNTSTSQPSLRPIVLSPQGIIVPKLYVPATGSNIAASEQVFVDPYLPWLYNTSRNYNKCRITNAVLIVTGNQATSTTQGALTIWSTKDVSDLSAYSSVLTFGGTGGFTKQIPFASLATGEKRVPLNLDTSWKTIALRTFKPGDDESDFTGALAPMHTVQELSFGGFFLGCGPQASAISPAYYSLEYTIEFSAPIGLLVNR